MNLIDRLLKRKIRTEVIALKDEVLKEKKNDIKNLKETNQKMRVLINNAELEITIKRHK